MQTNPATPQALDTFTAHYIAAALQLCDEEIGTDATIENLAPEALAKMEADCAEFFKLAFDGEAPGYMMGEDGELTPFPIEQSGTDFWLTRNGHGTGFWDREEMYGPFEAARLDEVSQEFNEADLYTGDNGLVYHSPA